MTLPAGTARQIGSSPETWHAALPAIVNAHAKIGVAEAFVDPPWYCCYILSNIYTFGKAFTLVVQDTASGRTPSRAEALLNSGLTLSHQVRTCIRKAAPVCKASVQEKGLLQVDVMSATAPWRSALLKSLDLNKELKYSTFFQLATVRPNGKPANRTMVYRGFVGESTKLTFTTDSRYNGATSLPYSAICSA
jgi:hypothetical protein